MKVGGRKSKNNRRTGKKKGNDLFALFQVQESQPVKGTGAGQILMCLTYPLPLSGLSAKTQVD